MDSVPVAKGTDIVLAKLHILAEGDRARAAEIVISDDDEYRQAGIILRDIKRNREEGMAEFDAIYTPLWQAVKALRDRKKEVLGPWERAEEALRSAMTDYHTRRQAEQEGARLAAAEAAMAGIEDVTDPAELIERASAAKAELQKVREPVSNPAGISYRSQWMARVEDVRALAAAVAAGEAEEDLILPNMKRLHELARGLRTKFQVPGCRAEEKQILQARG